MKHLLKMIKGSFVGMGSILPGISGSMIAAILNIYQDLIEALNKFTKHPIQSIIDVWQYIVGVLVGFGIGFFLINLVYQQQPLPITFLFIGFILGAIPSLVKEIKAHRLTWQHGLVFVLSIAMMIGLLFVKEGNSSASSWVEYIIVFVIGFITAISLITPGLSGATILIALGYYTFFIDFGEGFIRAVISLDFAEIMNQIPKFIILLLGVLVGLVLMGKVMYYVLKHYRSYFYSAVLGIVVISPFNVLFTLQDSTTENVFHAHFGYYIIGILLLFVGMYVAYMLSTKKLEEKHD